MPYLRKGELLPVKGQDLSIPSLYLPEGYGFPENMQFERGELRKRDGRSTLGSQAIGAAKILHLATFEQSTGTIRLMIHTKRNLLKYNTSSGLFEDVTGVDFSGGDTDYFDSCTVAESDLYIMTNYADNVRKYEDDKLISEDLGGSPQKAKCCEYMTPYVFLANREEGGLAIPTKGKWCDTGDPENWSTGNAGSQLFTDDTTPIKRVKKLANYLMIYKGGMSYRGRLVSTSDVFDFTILSVDRGLYGPRAIAEAQGIHFYMGTSDFHANNSVRIEDIGGPVREYIFNRVNREAADSCFAVHVEMYKEIWFYITTVGNSHPTEVWKYKYDQNFWYKDTVQNTLTGCNYRVISSLAWDDVPDVWDNQAFKWDDISGQSSAPIQVFGNDVGIVQRLNSTVRNDAGVAIQARQETKDYCGLGNGGVIGPEQDQRWLQADFWASGTTVDISYSLDFGQTWTFIETKTLTSNMAKHTVYLDIIAPNIRFRFQNDSLTGYFTFRSFIPYYLDSGEIENP